METEKCRALLWVLEKGSLSAGAEQLGYTPSGLSRMMAALEEEVGFPLLRRGRWGVEATRDCRRMLPAFRELAHWGERCTQLAGEIRGLETGTVTVATAYAAYYRWLTGLVARFQDLHPGVEVHLMEGNSTRLCRSMEEHRADFCVISRREGNYLWIPLRQDPMVAWVPAAHPLAKGKTFPLEAFFTQPYIETYPDQDTDNARIFAALGRAPKARFTSGDSYATYAMVEAGLGVSLDNGLIARDWGGEVAVLPVDPPQWVSIGGAAPSSLSPAAEKFVAFARTHLPADLPERAQHLR